MRLWTGFKWLNTHVPYDEGNLTISFSRTLPQWSSCQCMSWDRFYKL